MNLRSFAALALGLPLLVAVPARAQTVNTAQAVTVQGLLANSGNGGFKAAAFAPDGSLIVLANLGDGVRVYKLNSDATTVLAQAHEGAAGDSGVALALDSSGNIYVVGTTTSGALDGTSGAAFPTVADTSTNSFLAKYDANLNLIFLTFLGSGRTQATGVAATADSAFVTGLTYSAQFPVTPAGIQQEPATGSLQNGFVERFSSDGSTLVYATYLTGYGGNTTPAAIAADSTDAAYIDGTTTSSGYPTVAALEPEIDGSTSGFLTKLNPSGSGLVFSTFIAGSGLTGLALDASNNMLLVSGNVALGDFPVATVAMPLASTAYQTLLRIPSDGQSVSASVLLAAGTQSFPAAASDGSTWVSGTLGSSGLPLFPGVTQPDYPAGDSFLIHVTTTNAIDQTFRFGGLPVNNQNYASLTSLPAAPAVNASGTSVAFPATLTSTVAASLSSTQQFDLPLAAAPNSALPSTIRDVSLACSTSQCTGTGGLLALAEAGTSQPSLSLSIDDEPNLTLRNLGSSTADGLAITVSGFTQANNCGSSLAPSSACTIALSGSGPGSITISASNAGTYTVALPSSTTTADPVAISTDELDFGIATSSSPVTRTLTLTNLTSATQTVTAAANLPAPSYSLTLSASTCSGSPSTGTLNLAANTSCTVSFTVTPSTNSSNDGAVSTFWTIGTRDVRMTGYAEAADLNVSATEIDFGTQFTNTPNLDLPRFLYLSNNSAQPVEHTPVALPANSPFEVTDNCPLLLNPHSICQLELTYASTNAPSADTATLTLDDGLTVLLTGTTLEPASVTGSTADPNLTVAPTAITFTAPVAVTEVSANAAPVTVTNTGTAPTTLSVAVSGDFTITNGCPTSLAANASCTILVSFAPSQPGTRNGLLSITGGSGFAPTYVSLTGTATAILPANNGTLVLGQTYVGEPLTAWYLIQQPLSTLTVATGSAAFGVVLTPNTGYAPGTLPASAFTQNASANCSSCYLGVQFLSGVAGPQTMQLSLSSTANGNPEVLTLSATALPVQGLVLTPTSENFGPIDINSSSAPASFTLANLLSGTTVNVQSVSVSGDFAITGNTLGGPSCTGAVPATSACSVSVVFAPTATGQRSGTLTVTTDNGTATAALTGFGEPDPGLAFNPSALVFNNVSGPAATQQMVTLTNTSGNTLALGTPTVGTNAFNVTSTCTTLASGAQCTLTVTFTPQDALVTDGIALPVTATINGQTVASTYSIPLTATYAAPNAGLQITPSQANFGAQATGSLGLTREFTLTNSSTKTLAIALTMPQQFPLADPGDCAALAPGASCVFSVSFLSATTGQATGTVTATGTPSDGSAAITSLAYMLGFGQGAGTLSVSGSGLVPNSPVNFGQVQSGQTQQQTLTLTNTATTTLNIRRITSEPPFLSTTTCGAPLAPNSTCTITLTYAPVDEVASSSNVGPRQDSGQLVIESDASSSPETIALTGSVAPVSASSASAGTVLATFSLSQGALTFANTQVGNESPAQIVTLTNTGTQTLNISGVIVPADFTVSNPCTTLSAGQSCNLTVQFTPGNQSTSAVRSGTLEIQSNAAVSLDYITLLGASSAAPITLAPTSLDFGTVNVGSSDQLAVTVTNSAATPVTFVSATATGPYSIGQGTCPSDGATLAAGASCVLDVSFTPAAAGASSGTVSLATDATQLPLTVALSGMGAEGQLQISPGALAFGTIAVGAPANLSLTLTNNGTATVSGISTTLTGANAADFAVTVPCAQTALAPGASCTVTVTYTPSVVGAEAATLDIASSQAGSPAAVALTGTGSQPGSFTLTVNGANAATATVTSGTPAVYTLTLTPIDGFSGPVALTCTPVTPAQYASCSLLASSITLNGSAQTSTATINTITSATQTAAIARHTLAFAAMFVLLPWWTKRTRRRWLPRAMTLVCAFVLLSTLSGCGGSKSNLLYSPAGTYKYQVTASSTSGPSVSQTVTLTLVIDPR